MKRARADHNAASGPPTGAPGAAIAQGVAGRRPFLILLPFLSCAGLDYVLRVNNAMIAPELVAEFGLGPAGLGLITSAFFVAFALAQLPLGLALDRFGPRPVLTLLLAVAILGGLVYVSTESAAGLAFGRFLMGIGMSASLMGGIKAARLWYPPQRLPQITGALVALTGVGGMLATGPMAELLRLAAWREVLLGLLALLLVTMLMYVKLVPTMPPSARPTRRLGGQIADYAHIFASLHFWRFAPLGIVGIGVGISYQTLWAPLWLRDVAGYDARAQAWTLFAMFASFAAGNLGCGWLCRRRLAAGGSILPLAVGGLALSVALEVVLIATAGRLGPGWLWGAVSLLYAAPVASYALVATAFAPELAARAAASLNALVFVAVFATQWLTGVIIDAFPRPAAGGYAPEGHLTSLALVAGLQTLALLWCWAAPKLGWRG
jgi:predicted MFS family arabinose efflux permease